MIVAITGHRARDCRSEEDVRTRFRQVFEVFSPQHIICGAANGVDLWAADEARLLDIDIWVARPWAGHSPVAGDEQLYSRVIEAASRVVNVDESPKYLGPWMYHNRNEWMIDNSTHVLAYFNGKEKGGTYACLRYARRAGRPIRNIYDT